MKLHNKSMFKLILQSSVNVQQTCKPTKTLLKKSSNVHVWEQYKSGVSFIMQTLSLQAFKILATRVGPQMLNIIRSLQGKNMKHCSVTFAAAVPQSLRQFQIRKKGHIFYSIWVINHWCKQQRERLELPYLDAWEEKFSKNTFRQNIS